MATKKQKQHGCQPCGQKTRWLPEKRKHENLPGSQYESAVM